DGQDPSPIAEMAHIAGLNPDSARYNPDMTDEERNSIENLILLCPTCHTTIDRDPQKYTVSRLKEIKKDHEEWVNEQLTRSLPQVTFAELEVITKHLISTPVHQSEENLTVVPPAKKIQKNNLSDKVANLITKGMIGVEQVKEYLNKNLDPEFSERLKNGFVEKYLELRTHNLSGDEIFFEMLNFASNGSRDFSSRAAALTVLTYYFEICEVFER
ncbi:MAG: HNH endonuclease, partial [Thermotoga sp.]